MKTGKWQAQRTTRVHVFVLFDKYGLHMFRSFRTLGPQQTGLRYTVLYLQLVFSDLTFVKTQIPHGFKLVRHSVLPFSPGNPMAATACQRQQLVDKPERNNLSFGELSYHGKALRHHHLWKLTVKKVDNSSLSCDNQMLACHLSTI